MGFTHFCFFLSTKCVLVEQHFDGGFSLHFFRFLGDGWMENRQSFLLVSVLLVFLIPQSIKSLEHAGILLDLRFTRIRFAYDLRMEGVLHILSLKTLLECGSFLSNFVGKLFLLVQKLIKGSFRLVFAGFVG